MFVFNIFMRFYWLNIHAWSCWFSFHIEQLLEDFVRKYWHSTCHEITIFTKGCQVRAELCVTEILQGYMDIWMSALGTLKLTNWDFWMSTAFKKKILDSNAIRYSFLVVKCKIDVFWCIWRESKLLHNCTFVMYQKIVNIFGLVTYCLLFSSGSTLCSYIITEHLTTFIIMLPTSWIHCQTFSIHLLGEDCWKKSKV